MVSWKTSRRALGSMVFETSHRINSTRTAARAIVVEEINAEILRALSRNGERLSVARFEAGEA